MLPNCLLDQGDKHFDSLVSFGEGDLGFVLIYLPIMS
jgi:hypothetical protein